MKRKSFFALVVGLALASAPVWAQSTATLLNSPPPAPAFGDPLPGLTADQLAAFQAGLDEFTTQEVPATGLGPIFNSPSPTCVPSVACATCHSSPTVGGANVFGETRFGAVIDDVYYPLTELGGSLLQVCAIDPTCQETNPALALSYGVTAKRQTTPLFGAGLIEAIPDELILSIANSSKPFGITGHAAIVQDVATGEMRVGRFGWKAQVATLLTFAGDAYVNEMGITSRLFPTENAPNGDTNLLALCDHVKDPEDNGPVGQADIDKFANFMRFLGPPPVLSQTKSAAMGQGMFASCGCAVCHVPVLFTGPNPVAALDNKPVPLYSDLLVHDMGYLGDGIGQGAAGMREMRTAPLWGVRASGPYLHDGRAESIEKAIIAHEGEAAPARDRFQRLSDKQRQALLDFLNSI